MANQFDIKYLDDELNESDYTPAVVDAMHWLVNNDERYFERKPMLEWPIEKVDLEWFEGPLEMAEKAYREALARGCEPSDALEYADEAFEKYFVENVWDTPGYNPDSDDE